MCFPPSTAVHPNSLVEFLLNLSELMETKLQIGMTFFFPRLLIRSFPSYSLGSSYVRSRRLGRYRLWNPPSRTGAFVCLLSVVINLVKTPEMVTEHSVEQILTEHSLCKQSCAHCWVMPNKYVMIAILEECLIQLKGKINAYRKQCQAYASIYIYVYAKHSAFCDEWPDRRNTYIFIIITPHSMRMQSNSRNELEKWSICLMYFVLLFNRKHLISPLGCETFQRKDCFIWELVVSIVLRNTW